MNSKYIQFTFIIFSSFNALAQFPGFDTTITLDLLKSPINPAFNILGISLSDIQRPTDLAQFALSLQQTTNNLSSLPKSYGFEIAPFVGPGRYTLDEYNLNKKTLPQSFSISFGFTNQGPQGQEDVDSLTSPKLGLGIKFSLIRPKWSTQTQNLYNDIALAQKNVLIEYQVLIKNNPYNKKVEEFQNKIIEAPREPRILLEQLNDSLKFYLNKASTYANENLPTTLAFKEAQHASLAFKSEREGGFLDFTSGLVFDFPTYRFDYSKIQKAGVWLTGGYENGNKGITSMFIFRYLFQPDAIFADISGKLSTKKIGTFDAGARFLLQGMENKLTISSEAIYRSIAGKSELKPSWRLVFNVEYGLSINQKITFAFGRNFDGAVQKGGNLISALNFIQGLGTEKKTGDNLN